MCVDFMYILESKYSDPSNLGSFHFYGPKETHANRQSKFKKNVMRISKLKKSTELKNKEKVFNHTWLVNIIYI